MYTTIVTASENDPFAIFDAAPAVAASEDDPFAIFDSAPAVAASEDDPFAIFDSALAVNPSSPSAKRLCTPEFPSPVLPLVRRFLDAHLGDAVADLKRFSGDDSRAAAVRAAAASMAQGLLHASNHLLAAPSGLCPCRPIAEEVASLAWAALTQSGSWPHPSWREAYVFAQLMLACVSSALDGDAAEALRCLDRAFILGGPTDVFRDCVELLDEGPRCVRAVPPAGGGDAALVEGSASSTAAEETRAPLRPGVECGEAGEGSTSQVALPSRQAPWQARLQAVRARPALAGSGPRTVERLASPSTMESFRELQRRRAPLVLEGVANDWPALTRWVDFGWLRERHGGRLVPVELGSLAGEGQAGWRERLMPLSEFIDGCLLGLPSGEGGEGGAGGEGGEAGAGGAGGEAGEGTSPTAPRARAASVGYLAQHSLFEQIPQLRRDFTVPALCGDGLQHMNAWLGPEGTVTPLHYDSYDNVLTQVVGHKYVRLYDASQTKHLYPREGGGGGIDAQGNVSAVDIEAPDLVRFPEFGRAVGYECVLGPGEGLYIPAGCWHHVRSLSPSWSISFWF